MKSQDVSGVGIRNRAILLQRERRRERQKTAGLFLAWVILGGAAVIGTLVALGLVGWLK